MAEYVEEANHEALVCGQLALAVIVRPDSSCDDLRSLLSYAYFAIVGCHLIKAPTIVVTRDGSATTD